MEDAFNAKEKYKKQRKQVAKRKEASSSVRSGQQGVATQIRIFADNYKSSFLGTKKVGAGVSYHLMSSDKAEAEAVGDLSGAGVQSTGRCEGREKNTSSFMRAQRVVKKRLFDEKERRFGMGGDLKQMLRLNNKHLRYFFLSFQFLYVHSFAFIRYQKNTVESPPHLSRGLSPSIRSGEEDRRARQVVPILSGPSLRERVESRSLSMSLTDTETGPRALSYLGGNSPNFRQESEIECENKDYNEALIHKLGPDLEIKVGKRKSEFWTSASDMESGLSFCEVQIECFDV